MVETSSPKVVPAITKTDARELKALVNKDTTILVDELDYRRSEFADQISTQKFAVVEEVSAERAERDTEDAKASKAIWAKIERRITALNEAIVETVTELADAGWTSTYNRGRYNEATGLVNPHSYTVAMPDLQYLRPPTRDDSDLEERQQTAIDEATAMKAALNEQYNAAVRGLESQQAQVHRDLTLQSITTEAAQEFILSMPDVENLLPTPDTLEAIEA